jgi:hypothetical protein
MIGISYLMVLKLGLVRETLMITSKITSGGGMVCLASTLRGQID